MGCCGTEEENRQEELGERKCTDVFWLCLYILFWFLMIIIAAFSFVYGNPLRIINGYDSFGNTCGTNKNKAIGNMPLTGMDTTNKPYLLFYDITELKQTLKICVKECPTKKLTSSQDLYNYHISGNDLCRYDFNYNELTSSRGNSLSGSIGPCPVLPVHQSTPVLNRCVPTKVKDVTEALLKNFYDLLNSWNTVEQILGDLYSTWKEILGLTFLSLLVSLVTIGILHCLAHLVSYFIMIGFTLASIGGTAFLWYTYFDIKFHLDKTQKYMLLSESIKNETAFLYFSIIATVITIIILIIIIFMRKQVDFLADLFQETSKCLMHLPQLFLQPLLTFVVLVLFFMFWIFVVLCLATASFPEKSPVTPVISNVSRVSTNTYPTQASQREMNMEAYADRVKISVIKYTDASWIRGMWWVYFIGLIWTSEFIMACQQMVIAGSVAHWFYRHKYKDNAHLCYATSKLIKYHLGSVALGSLIITIFKIPRLIMMYLHEKWSRGKEKGNECATCGLRCCICCFYCLEKFIRYLNHNAYTVIAIDGSNFCKAAGTAFEVLTTHVLQVATINSLGDFILFLGKCFVTAVTGCVGLAIFRRDPNLTFYAAPTLLVCVFAFFIAHCILSLYEMVLDTVYLCMCQSGDAPDGIKMQNLGVTRNEMYIASVSSTIKFHDFPNGNIVHNYQPGQIEGPVKSISWSKDGTWLLVVPYSGQTEIVCIKDQIKLLKTIHEIDEPSYACFQNTAKKYVGVGTKNGLVLVYDIKSRNVKKRFTRVSTPITQIAFTCKDSHCIVGCKNGDVLMYNNVTNSPATNLRIPKSNSISCLKTSNLKRNLVMGGSVEGIVVVWDINMNRNKFFVEAHQAPINSVAFSPVNSELILTAGADRKICFFDIVNGKCIASLAVDNSITSVDFSPDGCYFVTASQNGRVFVHDTRNIQEPVHSFIAHNSAIHHIAFQNVQESNFSSMCSVSSTSLVTSVPSSENLAPRKSTRISDFFHLSHLTDHQSVNEVSQCSQDDSFMAALGLDKNSLGDTNKSVSFRDNRLPSIPDEPILEIENKKFEPADFKNIQNFSTPKFNCENKQSLNPNPSSTGLSDGAVDEIKSLIKECVSEEFKNVVSDLKEHIQYQATHTTYQLRSLLLDLHMANVKEFIKLENFNNQLKDELTNTVNCVNNLLQENERLKNEVQFLKNN